LRSVRRQSADGADIRRTHPVAIIGGVLIENSFFSRPEDFLREVRSRTGPMQAYRS
jgi:hypothetical protein